MNINVYLFQVRCSRWFFSNYESTFRVQGTWIQWCFFAKIQHPNNGNRYFSLSVYIKHWQKAIGKFSDNLRLLNFKMAALSDAQSSRLMPICQALGDVTPCLQTSRLLNFILAHTLVPILSKESFESHRETVQ